MNKRSLEQSKYRWAVVVPMLQDCWKEQGFDYTPEQVNFMMKISTRCYVERIETPWGETTIRELSTAKGTPQMFEEWLDQVRDWAYKSFDLDIPTPNAIPIEAYDEKS